MLRLNMCVESGIAKIRSATATPVISLFFFNACPSVSALLAHGCPALRIHIMLFLLDWLHLNKAKYCVFNTIGNLN